MTGKSNFDVALGFEIDGIKKHALFINGKYIDEYCMTKLLE